MSDGFAFTKGAFQPDENAKCRTQLPEEYDVVEVSKFNVVFKEGTKKVNGVQIFEMRVIYTDLKECIGNPIAIADYTAANFINPQGKNDIPVKSAKLVEAKNDFSKPKPGTKKETSLPKKEEEKKGKSLLKKTEEKKENSLSKKNGQTLLNKSV